MRARVCLLLVVIFLSSGCSDSIDGKYIGDLTVEQAVDLYKTRVTVEIWLNKINATPSLLKDGSFWVQLKDGKIIYTEKIIDGIPYVYQLGCDPNDTATKSKLDEANKK